MDTVAGGGHHYPDCRGTQNGNCCYDHWETDCDSGNSRKYGRPFRNPDGTPNCAATVEDGSWCDSNDACYNKEVRYLSLNNCAKAWD